MKRVSVRQRSGSGSPAIQGVDYHGSGSAGAPGGAPRGRVVRIVPGLPWANRGFKRPRHPLNRMQRHPFRQHTPGYY
jgi:hypothetical protein